MWLYPAVLPAMRELSEEQAEAWLKLQILMLDQGAQIRTYIPDEDVWADIETRLRE